MTQMMIKIIIKRAAFYDKLDHILKHFPKIMFGDLKPKIRTEDSFKVTVENESVHKNSNDNGAVRLVNFVMSKHAMSTMFPH
jgi:hypothetical protein